MLTGTLDTVRVFTSIPLAGLGPSTGCSRAGWLVGCTRTDTGTCILGTDTLPAVFRIAPIYEVLGTLEAHIRMGDLWTGGRNPIVSMGVGEIEGVRAAGELGGWGLEV